MWHDSETERDFLNFTGVADTVAEIIEQADGEPVSIGVSGAWGVGKSSMLKLVRQSLSGKKERERKILFVEFNAWLYQGYDDARAALMEVIAHALSDEAEQQKSGVDKAKELLQRVDWLRVAKAAASTAGALALGIPPIGLAGEALELVKKMSSGELDGKDLGQMQKTASEISTAAADLLKAKGDSSPPKEIQAIRKCFEDTLEAMGVTLVVLIDDLDRCLPSTTISTLEAIRLFLFLKHTAFIIAADTEIIKHAVKRHFGEIDDNAITSYFDKLIQIPIRVPPLGNQEVRAYLILLYVQNSELDEDKKESIRTRVCAQLRLSWQGKRVDRAFIESLYEDLPPELIARCDAADRLAPLMVTAKGISGNPRLIKRFLNAIAIRMAIARAHGVDVDESALMKMLLFERCGEAKAYSKITAAVSNDHEGKPRFLRDWEAAAREGREVEWEAGWDSDFALEWLRLPPELADRDLRGILYVSRDHSPLLTIEDRLSSDAAETLSLLVEHPDMAASVGDRLSGLQAADLSVIMSKLLERARLEQEWGAPPILEACLVVAGADDKHGLLLCSFLSDRPAGQIKPSIVPKISNQPWAETVFASWESNASISTAVKSTIKETRKYGNVAK